MTDERTTNGRTKILYEDDAYVSSFKATVLEIVTEGDKKAAVLDVTAFFPEGGGQGADTGFIGDTKVTDVQRVNGEILHYFKGNLEAGSVYECRLDFEKRYDRMQNHTGEHIICGLINKEYGLDNVGFHLSDDVITVDLNGYLEYDELLKIEKKANELIAKGAKVNILYPSKEELKGLNYRSKIEDLENVRLVEIEGIDLCACCAPHLDNIANVQVIKILSSMSHRGGVRFTMIAGKRAVDDYALLHNKAMVIVKLTSLPKEKMDEGVVKFKEDIDKYRTQINELKETITAINMVSLKERIAGNPDAGVIVYPAKSLDEIQKRALINEGVLKFEGIIMVVDDVNEGNASFIAGRRADATGLSLKDFKEKLMSEFGAKGGGSDVMIQGRIQINKEIKDRLCGL
jgi:alanyl-tRNA synthetase